MFDYLQQFNSLPKDLKDKVSSKEVMASLAEIESRYRVDLAMIVMKVMIKGLSLKDLPSIFIGEFDLTPEQAEKMAQELKEKIFINVSDYVGLSTERRSLDLSKDINILIKEAGLVLASEFLIERLNKILAIYLRGVRSRIDTRASLAKDIATGGLNLSSLEIDRVLKVCDNHKFKYDEIPSASLVGSAAPLTRLDKIVSASDKATTPIAKINSFSNPVVEYDLKRALASGETKRIEAPINKPVAKPVISEVTPDVILNPINNSVSNPTPVLTPTPNSTSTPTLASAPSVAAVENPAQVIKEPVVAKWTPTDPQKPIVRKPENNSFIKKIFADTKPSVNAAVPIASTIVPPKPIVARKSILGDVAPSSSRPIMHDVKPAPKIMGPMEEIQFLDLVNFRRLGTTPEEITAKVFNKIKLLEKDGYEKMIAGISAWRKSPVSRLYLHIVQEAVISNLPLKDAIEKREKNKQEGLTLAEIEAIMNLNSKLIF